MSTHSAKKIFSLEASKENGRIKIAGYERLSGDEKTLRQYEFHEIRDEDINASCSAIIEIINRASIREKVDKSVAEDLKIKGQILYDSIFPTQIKHKLSLTSAEYMILHLDEGLVHIPWELLHDGKTFLCLRFNIGRLVSTNQKTSDAPVRKISGPLSMLIVADPRGDLQSSYIEGERLTEELDSNHETVEVDLRSSPLDTQFLKGVLRNYDIVHYAGHADYDVERPSNSGFLLNDGRFSAADIINMIGELPLPSMIFSNACKSGYSLNNKAITPYETEIFGLANAFLLAGVQHYIGTFWDIQDEPGLYFALDFYRELMNSASIGSAIRKARLSSLSRYGDHSIIWSSYMLYGDPTFSYNSSFSGHDADETLPNESPDSVKNEMPASAVTRSGTANVIFREKGNKWLYAVFAILLALTSLIYFIKTDNNQSPVVRETIIYKKDPASEKQKRIEKLVSILGTADNSLAKDTSKYLSDNESDLPTIVFLDISEKGMDQIDKQYILDKTTELLHSSGRVKIVERSVLDALLQELQLSHSRLTDMPTALKVGRMLSAKLITVGNMLKDDNTWQINLRFIETETSTIRAALTDTIESEDKNRVAEHLSDNILLKVRREYPLKGTITSVRSQGVVINIGAVNGVTRNIMMKVINPADGAEILAGRIRITSVNKNIAAGQIISSQENIQKGFRVEEIL